MIHTIGSGVQLFSVKLYRQLFKYSDLGTLETQAEQKLSTTMAVTIVLLPHCSSRSNASTREDFVGIGFSRGQRKENLLNRIQFQIPQRLIPSTSPRSGTFAL